MKRNRYMQLGVTASLCFVGSAALMSCASGSQDEPQTSGDLFGSGGFSNNPGSSGASGFGNGAFPSSSGGASSSAGGFTNGGSGAVVSNGGVSNSGAPNGGAGNVGGTPGTGGQIGQTGGAPSGGTGTGGSPGTAGPCVDMPPPNGDTCAHAVLYQWCGAPWMNGACAQTCGLCTGTGGTGTGGTMSTGGRPSTGGTTSTGGVVNTGGTPPNTGGTTSTGGATGNPPPLQGGQTGWASRYWDCCKPACGWTGNVSGTPMSSCDQSNQSLGGNYGVTNACDGGGAFMCWSGAPWSVSDTLSYGFAAASGTDYVCGRCYQLQFSGSGHSNNDPGSNALNGKTMIVQVINNGGVESDQFDLLIPGGGVGANNACTTQWGSSDLGAQYGGFLTACNGDKTCVQQKCNSVFAGKSELLAGCNWFLGWFDAANNPNLQFKQIACPSAITSRSGLTDPG